MNSVDIHLSRLYELVSGKPEPEQREATRLPPWVFPDGGHLPFIERNAVTLPGIGGTATVLSFTVPRGMNGVIKRIANVYLGGGFVSGSGDIVWRILADGRPVRNFSNITSEFGSLESPLVVDDLIVYSNQRIEYTVTHVANVALGDLTLCHMSGYFYTV